MSKLVVQPALLANSTFVLEEADDQIREAEYTARNEAAFYGCTKVIRKVEIVKEVDPFRTRVYLLVSWYGKSGGV